MINATPPKDALDAARGLAAKGHHVHYISAGQTHCLAARGEHVNSGHCVFEED